MHIQRLSWAGVKLEYGDTTLFIDAVQSMPDPVPLSARTPYRYALLTHHHGDHTDIANLKEVLTADGKVVTHADIVPHVDTRGLKVHPVGLYEPVILSPETGDFVVRAVPAVDGLGDPQVSWVVEAAGIKIIHCGDTLWHGHWWNIARAYGPFDVALLPVNGARYHADRYDDSGIPIVMTPAQAVAAARLLQTHTVIPIHYGLHDPPAYVEHPDAATVFTALARERGVHVTPTQPGETVTLELTRAYTPR